MTGADLRRIRLEHGLTQEAFGRALGLSGTGQSVQTSLYRYEAGLRPVPPRIVLHLLDLGWYSPPKRRAS